MVLRLAALWLLVSAVAAGAAPAPLPTEQIVIESGSARHHFTVEIAADPASRDRGLMFRKHLARDHGMLFDFHSPVMTAFWMKNTPIPLDMLFVRVDGRISSIAANAVPYAFDDIPSNEPVRAVIEIRGGRAAALHIAPGDLVRAAAFGNRQSSPKH